jgi:hypothetical protein
MRPSPGSVGLQPFISVSGRPGVVQGKPLWDVRAVVRRLPLAVSRMAAPEGLPDGVRSKHPNRCSIVESAVTIEPWQLEAPAERRVA